MPRYRHNPTHDKRLCQIFRAGTELPFTPTGDRAPAVTGTDRLRGPMSNLRIAARSLLRSPAFSVAAVLALALGIGANTSVFSVVNAVLLRALPYADEGRVVRVHNRWNDTPEATISPAEHFDYVDGTEGVFSAYGTYATGSVNLTGDGAPERLNAGFVSAGVLAALGVTPTAGRLIADEEAGAANAPVALVSERFVARRMAGESVVGRDLRLNGQAYTVVGVVPGSFRLPTEFGSATAAEVLLPLGLDRATVTDRGSHFLEGVARLAPGIPMAAAEREIASVAGRFVTQFPDDYPTDMRFGVYLVPIREDIVGAVRPVVLTLLAAVGLVLLVTCTNVASLLLARSDGRRREFAVRTALGAGRREIAGMVLLETGVLSVAAGVLGIVLAAWGTSALLAFLPAGVGASLDVSMDVRVLGFALGVTVLATLLAGLAPLTGLRRIGMDAQSVLREGGRGTTLSATRQRLRSLLVTGEVAVAVVLLVGAGLLLRSFVALLSVDPGYQVENVLTTRISLPDAEYPDDASRRTFFATLGERIRSIPGVAGAGAVTNLPLASSLGDINIRIEGRPMREGEVSPRLDWQAVTPGYFDAMGMRIVEGRGFTASDDARAPGAVVLNESGARQHFPDGDAIGRRFVLGGEAGPGTVTVIGIVADIRHASLDAEPRGEMYLAHGQFTFWNGGSAPNTMQLVVRTTVPPATIAGAVREAVGELDADLPISALSTMEEVEARSVAQPRFLLVLIGAFAAVALLLAAIGLYGLIAFIVGQRTHEIGVRMALGARAIEVVGMVMRQGMAMVGAGLALGLLGALVVSRAIRGLLYDIGPSDPLTLVSVTVVLAAVGALACVLPARRAAVTPPQEALRVD